VIKLQPAPCRAAVAIFSNKRAPVTVTLKNFLANTRGDVTSCCVVRPLLGSARQMASERYSENTVDQVLLAKASEAFLGLAVE
jgi:hypothetical protein